MNETDTIYMCGLPASGKTTFLAAFGYQLSAGEIQTSLNMTKLAPERQYIDQLADSWVGCEHIDRTKEADNYSVDLLLETEGYEYRLKVPDLSGETWERIWSNRTCQTELVNEVANSTGILFFLHAHDIVKPVPVIDGGLLQQEDMSDEDNEEIVPWKPGKDSPTQAVATDLLQLLAREPFTGKSKKLVIILSAWDMVKEKNVTPERHLEEEFPLLHQYLTNGCDYENWSVFGVSAQGGCINKDVEKLSEIENPSERVIIQSGETESNDLTLLMKQLIAI